MPARAGRASYAQAGVDLAAAEEVVERFRALAATTARSEVLGGVGGFGGLFGLDPGRWRRPTLVASTDGVGTKMLVARASGRYDTVGIDLVAMCVDDVVCSGAEPLFLLDYLAAGRLDPPRAEAIVRGIAHGCRQAGCALLGGETAEHPDAMAPDDVDLAGFAVGVVERDEMLGGHRVTHGDALVGLRSPGLRSNGYALARQVLLERAGLPLDGPAWPGSDRTLADELLTPSRVYCRAVLGAIAAAGRGVRAAAHVTGGGIPQNLLRVLPDGCGADVRTSSWERPRIFEEISRLGQVTEDEMARVFNLGIGMILVVAADAAGVVEAALREHGQEPIQIGHVVPGPRVVRLR